MEMRLNFITQKIKILKNMRRMKEKMLKNKV